MYVKYCIIYLNCRVKEIDFGNNSCKEIVIEAQKNRLKSG